MHPCFYVDEILRVVFGCIEDRSTLCVLARTCRAFHEPAMDLIWETLTAMELILQNLSSASIVSEGRNTRVTLSRPLSDNDWNTVRRLSSRVRRLHTFFNPSAPYVPWFGCLTSPPDPSFLFPNLRALSFGVSILLDRSNAKEEFQAIVRFFFLLLGPHLSALRITIPGAFYPHFDLPSIPLLCPNIRALDIATPDDRWDVISMPAEAVHLCSKLVSELCNLEIIWCFVTSWDLLNGFAQAKALRRLRVELPRQLSPGPEYASGNNFSQLRSLDVGASCLASLTDLFRWTSLNVIELRLYCLAYETAGDASQDLVNISSMISSQCKALKLLWFLFPKIKPYDQTPSTWPRPMLERYQACHQLRVIALDTPYSLTLADNDLEDMVKAWPHLEVFHLFYGGTEYPPPVQLTLRGVTALLFHCSKLTHFALTFDATRVPEDAVPPSHETLPPVKYMGVYRSPVSDSSDVAAYLSIILPYLEIIGVDEWQCYWPEWRWICTQHDKRPTMDADRSPMKIYSLLSAGSKYTNEWLACNTEWWHSRQLW